MARCGLRSQEAKDVAAEDIVEVEDGTYRVRVWQDKGSKYREVPVPRWLAKQIQTTASARQYDDHDPIHSLQQTNASPSS